MKKETVKCKFCDIEIRGEACQLAAYSTVIDGKTYTFCCLTCASQYKQDKVKAK